MPYYCDICKATITEGEYKYSNDVFGKSLCRKHQDMERVSSSPQNDPSNEPTQELIKQNTKQIKEKESESKIGFKGIAKKLAVATGKVIKKSATTITDTTRKAVQRRGWKDKILMRLDSKMIKQLAREKRVRPEFVDKPTNDDYIDAIKNGVSLDDIISFAKRNQINIREIIQEIDTKKSEWRLKEFTEQDEEQAQTLLVDIQKAIQEYKPARRYYQEILYQDTLVAHLTAKLPDREVKIEKQRGSSRPDIIVDNVAIEIKGPTTQQSIDTIASKCMRYKMHFPGGLIIVLFDVQVNDYYYNEWEAGLKRTHPDVIVIKKS